MTLGLGQTTTTPDLGQTTTTPDLGLTTTTLGLGLTMTLGLGPTTTLGLGLTTTLGLGRTTTLGLGLTTSHKRISVTTQFEHKSKLRRRVLMGSSTLSLHCYDKKLVENKFGYAYSTFVDY